jgi:hypothetical protein
LSGESWHLEPIGLQSVLKDAKTNPELAKNAINSGIRKGGSGAGDVMRKAAKVTRYPDMVKEIMQMDGKAVEDKSPALQRLVGEAEVKSISDTKVAPIDQKKADNQTNPTVVQSAPSADSESKPGAAGAGVKPGTGAGIQIGNDTLKQKGSTENAETMALQGNDVNSIKTFIGKAASMNGVDENTAQIVAFLESGFKSGAASSESSAKGVFQFTNDSWKEYLGKYLKLNGAKAGLTAESKATDPRANIILGTWALRRYAEVTKTTDPVILYLNHLLGEAGAARFLQHMNTGPSTPANTVFETASASNKAIFYKEGGKGQPRTIREVYDYLAETKIASAAKTLGLPLPKMSAPMAPANAGATPASVKPSTSMSISGVQPSASSAASAATSGAANVKSAVSNPAPSGNASANQVYRAAPVAVPSPSNAGVSTAANNIDAGMMKNTESILTDSLKVQNEILKAIQQIKASMDQRSQTASKTEPASDAETAQASSKAPVKPYAPPEPVVSMAKRKF